MLAHGLNLPFENTGVPCEKICSEKKANEMSKNCFMCFKIIKKLNHIINTYN